MRYSYPRLFTTTPEFQEYGWGALYRRFRGQTFTREMSGLRPSREGNRDGTYQLDIADSDDVQLTVRHIVDGKEQHRVIYPINIPERGEITRTKDDGTPHTVQYMNNDVPVVEVCSVSWVMRSTPLNGIQAPTAFFGLVKMLPEIRPLIGPDERRLAIAVKKAWRARKDANLADIAEKYPEYPDEAEDDRQHIADQEKAFADTESLADVVETIRSFGTTRDEMQDDLIGGFGVIDDDLQRALKYGFEAMQQVGWDS